MHCSHHYSYYRETHSPDHMYYHITMALPSQLLTVDCQCCALKSHQVHIILYLFPLFWVELATDQLALQDMHDF